MEASKKRPAVIMDTSTFASSKYLMAPKFVPYSTATHASNTYKEREGTAGLSYAMSRPMTCRATPDQDTSHATETLLPELPTGDGAYHVSSTTM